MRKIILLFAITVIYFANLQAQSQENNQVKDKIGSRTFIGYYNNHVVYRQDNTWDLYLVIEGNKPTDNLKYQFFESGKKEYINNERTKVKYIKNDFRISTTVIRESIESKTFRYKLKIESDKYNLDLPIVWLRTYFAVNEEKDLIITTGRKDFSCEGCDKEDYIAPELMQIDLTKPNPKLENIGIRGRYFKIIKNHLYFHQYFEEFAYDEKYNLYRVPLRDWKNTELVFRQTFDKCYVFPDEKYLFASIYEREKNNTRYILYNIETRSYELLRNIDSLFTPNIPNEIWRRLNYKGADSYSYKHDLPFISGIKYYYVKNLPDSFPRKLRHIPAYYAKKQVLIYRGYEAFEDLPKKVDLDVTMLELRKHNFPRPHKPFTNTFITDSLMYNATQEELEKLSKEELRLLRNAFFARLGYKFKSQDLQEFFNRFEWYINSMDRKMLSNDEIIIPDEDRERIDLIREIENNK